MNDKIVKKNITLDEDGEGTKFRLENILVKNLSLEIPENVVSPKFSKEPSIQIELRNTSRPLSRENYSEVVLEATVRVKDGEDLQLLIEISQAGIFCVENADAERRQALLNTQAPELLYPYLSQLVSDMMSRSGAPRIFLPPFNFRALYDKRQEMMKKQLEEKEGE